MQVTRFPSRAEGLADRMTGFVAHLRMNGLPLGPQETADALAVLAEVDATDADQTRRALKVLLVPDAEGWLTFDALFDAYWFNAGRTRQRTASPTASPHVRSQSARSTLWQAHLEADGGTDTDGSESTRAMAKGTRRASRDASSPPAPRTSASATCAS